MRPVLMAAALSLLLSACQSLSGAQHQLPVGSGSGPHDLKRSPCACLEIPMSLPEGTRQSS